MTTPHLPRLERPAGRSLVHPGWPVTTMLNGAMLTFAAARCDRQESRPDPRHRDQHTRRPNSCRPPPYAQLLATISHNRSCARQGSPSFPSPIRSRPPHSGARRPEQHGRTDLHEVFPGNPARPIPRQMIAATITARRARPYRCLHRFSFGRQRRPAAGAALIITPRRRPDIKQQSLALGRARSACRSCTKTT